MSNKLFSKAGISLSCSLFATNRIHCPPRVARLRISYNYLVHFLFYNSWRKSPSVDIAISNNLSDRSWSPQSQSLPGPGLSHLSCRVSDSEERSAASPCRWALASLFGGLVLSGSLSFCVAEALAQRWGGPCWPSGPLGPHVGRLAVFKACHGIENQ